jgi:hypothetical protein
MFNNGSVTTLQRLTPRTLRQELRKRNASESAQRKKKKK